MLIVVPLLVDSTHPGQGGLCGGVQRGEQPVARAKNLPAIVECEVPTELVVNCSGANQVARSK